MKVRQLSIFDTQVTSDCGGYCAFIGLVSEENSDRHSVVVNTMYHPA